MLSRLATVHTWLSIILICLGFFGNPDQVVSAEQQLTVHLLDSTGKIKTESRFWIDWNNEWLGILKTRKASPELTAKAIQLMKASLTHKESDHFCGHRPAYGIVATDADGKVLRTSLCFECFTWVLPGRRLNINAQSEELAKVLKEITESTP